MVPHYKCDEADQADVAGEIVCQRKSCLPDQPEELHLFRPRRVLSCGRAAVQPLPSEDRE